MIIFIKTSVIYPAYDNNSYGCENDCSNSPVLARLPNTKWFDSKIGVRILNSKHFICWLEVKCINI